MPASRAFQPRTSITSIAAIVTVCLLGAGTEADARSAHATIANAASCRDAGFPAIRTRDESVARQLNEGAAHSATLAAEICEILNSDVIVFIETALALPPAVDGYLVFLSSTPMKRFVRIRVSRRLNDLRLIALIGHEFRHVLEIASHPEVVDSKSLGAMYQRFGRSVSGTEAWDSEAAVLTGAAVLRELVSASNWDADE